MCSADVQADSARTSGPFDGSAPTRRSASSRPMCILFGAAVPGGSGAMKSFCRHSHTSSDRRRGPVACVSLLLLFVVEGTGGGW